MWAKISMVDSSHVRRDFANCTYIPSSKNLKGSLDGITENVHNYSIAIKRNKLEPPPPFPPSAILPGWGETIIKMAPIIFLGNGDF